MISPRLILIFLGLNIFLTVGLGAFAYSLYAGEKEDGAAHSEQASSADYTFFAVDKIVFNLHGTGREHYFVLDLALQAELPAQQELLEQLEPMIRNTVVTHLSQMPFAELRSLPIPQLQASLETALFDDFSSRRLNMPFSAVLVSKLLVQ